MEMNIRKKEKHQLHPLFKIIIGFLFIILMFANKYKIPFFLVFITLLILKDGNKTIYKTMGRAFLFCLFMGFIAFLFGNNNTGCLIVIVQTMLLIFSGIYLSCIPVSDLLRGLSACGLPDIFLLGFLIVFRFFNVLSEELNSIRQSRSMLPKGSISWYNRIYRCMLVPFVFRLFSLSDQLALSVNSRDYGVVKRTQYKEVKILKRDILEFILIISICVVIWQW